jgi:hypothetical protein
MSGGTETSRGGLGGVPVGGASGGVIGAATSSHDWANADQGDSPPV